MSNEFKYTREWTDEGAFPLLGFTKNWENPSDYPTYEPDEMQVRKDMQSLHDEVKDFLNNELIPRVVAEDATVEAWTYAEEQRAANEVTRVANEEQRVANEAARVAAESGRTAAEQARTLAEQARVDSTTGIVAQATEQARAASASAGYAADSASAASASAAEATQQAGIAFTWASHAEQAANHAAAAANGADDSRIRAEESAGQAAASASSAARSESEAKRYAEQASSAGSGDMLQSVYDPTGKRQDVFKYVDTKVSNIPTPDVSGQIASHNSSTSAHADIRTALNGKAPAGYGLGSDMGMGIVDCNAAVKNGWYYTGGSTANVPLGPIGEILTYSALLVSARGAYADQIYFAHSSGLHSIWHRWTPDTGATWSDWRCISYNYGATDLTAGSSRLLNGQLYFVYE